MLSVDEYKRRFSEPLVAQSKDATKDLETRAGRALTSALDIRKFEIELYWKRATYYWAFIAAAFAGYALTYKTAAEYDPWLTTAFSSLGLVFSFAWYLVNRGSKFWQNNWERHVDLLESMTLGPLYKVIAVCNESIDGNPLISAGQFSVSKINQILSVFVTTVWLVMLVKALLPISIDLQPDFYKIAVFSLTVIFLYILYRYGKSSSQYLTPGLHERNEALQPHTQTAREPKAGN